MEFQSPFPGSISHFEETDSTMQIAKKAIANSIPQTGSTYVANYQTAGRGRRQNKQWQAAPGTALLCSIILPEAIFPTSPAPSITCSLAVAKVIEHYCKNKKVEIKWPNDILIQGKKIAGILCESYKKWIIVGIGVNVNAHPDNKDINMPATCISDYIVNPPDIHQLLSKLLFSLQNYILNKPELIVEEVRRKMAYFGETMTWISSPNKPPEYGVLIDIAQSGAAIFRKDNGEIIEVATGELRVIF